MTALDFALGQVRDRDLVIESLREQLAVHERWIDSYGHPEEWVKRAQAAHGRAEAAEAKLAEVEKERDKHPVCVVCPECSAIYTPDVQGINSQMAGRIIEQDASMDRARELALDTEGIKWTAAGLLERLDRVARLLSEAEPTTKGDT